MGDIEKLKRIRLGSGDLPVMVDARQLSEITGMSIQTVWRGARDGILPHYRLSRSVRFDALEILEIIRQDSTAANGAKPSWEDKLEDFEVLNFEIDEDELE